MLSVSITAVELGVLKVIDLRPNLQTNILPALFSWPEAMLREGQSLVLMDFALVGTECVRACHTLPLLCLYELWTHSMNRIQTRT